MRCVSFFSLFLSGFLPALAFAQQQPDSVAGRKLPLVEIVTSQPKTFAVGSRQTLIDSAFLRQNNSGSVADLLRQSTPVYIKTYGQGMVSSAAFRGTSASHTAVLWNGFNISLPSLGQSDFSLLPNSAISSVQLQHGSAGSNFGSGAIGGAVLLQSAETYQAGWQLQAQQDLGSFGYTFSRLGASYGFSNAGLEASVFRKFSQNHFPFINTAKFGSPHEKQENAAILQQGFTLNGSLKLSGQSTLALHSWYTDQANEIQPNMGAANNKEKLANRNLRSMAAWSRASNWGKTVVKAAVFTDFMRYQSLNLSPADTYIKTYQAQAEHGIRLKEKGNLNFGADLQYFTGEVDGYKKPVTELRNAFFAAFRYEIFRRLQVNLNWRQAFVQGFDPPPVPAAGFNYAFFQRNNTVFSWKGNVARGFRVPTLNDRYWPSGNEALLPETSWNYESGLRLDHNQNNLEAETELTAYALKVKNWIQWVPVQGIIWTPQNLQEVQASGLEFSGKLTYHLVAWKLQGGGNYAFTRSVQKGGNQVFGEALNKQLIYTPLHTATAFADFRFQNWFLTFRGSYTGKRFITDDNERSLPFYSLLDVYAGKTVLLGNFQVQVQAQVNNLTNVIYQNMQFYAMPGRSFQVSMRFQLH
jgi:vitamin B12 transporter